MSTGGDLDEGGDFIVAREQIYPLGSFHGCGPSGTIFRKVE